MHTTSIQHAMRAVQKLAFGDRVSEKWSNHVWSPQAVSNALKKCSEIIKLVSSQDGYKVTIHRELLCFFSSYYAAALNGKFIEAKNDRFEVDLSEEHLHAFADWIYTGSFNMEFLSETEECLYVNLYLFADQMDIIALRRSALSNLADQEPLSWESVKIILMNLPETSLLRKFALDSFIAHWEPSNSRKVPQLDNSTNSEYLLALYKFVGEVLTGVALRKLPVNDCTECPCCVNLCTYHEHENKEEWKETCGQIKNAKRSVFGLY